MFNISAPEAEAATNEELPHPRRHRHHRHHHEYDDDQRSYTTLPSELSNISRLRYLEGGDYGDLQLSHGRFCCENPFPDRVAKDCIYISTMFMNGIYTVVTGVFLFGFHSLQFPDYSLSLMLYLFSILVILACLVCFIADAIICCKLDIHNFADTCPLIFWMLCNSVLLLLHLVQMIMVIVVWFIYGNSAQASAIGKHQHGGSDRAQTIGQDTFTISVILLLVIGFSFFLIRGWFIFVVNHMRRVMDRKYSNANPGTAGRVGWNSDIEIDELVDGFK